MLPGGDTLFRQGDAGDALYILASARLAAIVEGEDGQEHLAGEVSPGETVGEMAVMTGEPRNATIRAIRDSEVVKLSKASFEKLIEDRPLVLLPIARTIIGRLRRATSASIAIRSMTIAIAPAGMGAPVAGFAARLASWPALVSSLMMIHHWGNRVNTFFEQNVLMTR